MANERASSQGTCCAEYFELCGRTPIFRFRLLHVAHSGQVSTGRPLILCARLTFRWIFVYQLEN